MHGRAASWRTRTLRGGKGGRACRQSALALACAPGCCPNCSADATRRRWPWHVRWLGWSVMRYALAVLLIGIGCGNGQVGPPQCEAIDAAQGGHCPSLGAVCVTVNNPYPCTCTDAGWSGGGGACGP